MGNGYVKLWRSTNDNDILANDNNAYIVFTRLLMLVDRNTGSYTTGRKKLAMYMNMKESTLYGVLKRLERATMLQVNSNTYATTFHICNWSKWQQEDNTSATHRQSNGNTKQEEEKKKNIDTNVSNNMVIKKSPRADIDEMFAYWEMTTGIPISSNLQKNRFAASNLIKKHGIDKLKDYVIGVNFAQQTAYAPKISDFVALQSKLGDLLVWAKGVKQTNSKKVVSV